jgi:hypothetical protein
VTARPGTAARLAEVRAEERARLDARIGRRGTIGNRGAWRIIARGAARLRAMLARDQVLVAYPDLLRQLDAVALDHEAARLDSVPCSPVVAAMRLEIEIEQAGRRWQAAVRQAERIGWTAVFEQMPYTAVVGAA